MKIVFKSLRYLVIAIILSIIFLLSATFMSMPGSTKVKIVKSGSMEPAIKTGSLVFIAPKEVYIVGDIVTFGPDDSSHIPTTHRIISAVGDREFLMFITKGDANEAPDKVMIRQSDIYGVVVRSVPYLGFVIDFARQPVGFGLLVGLPALILIFIEVSKIIRQMRKLENKENN